MAHCAYIALGSNLDTPSRQIKLALNLLAQMSNIKIIHQAPFYQNPPVGYQTQPEFVNTVCGVDTSLKPLALLDVLQEIEIKMGRVRTIKNGPRVIDLDLILYDEIFFESPRLIIPHPRFLERDFVLWPLYQCNPELILPDGTPLQSLLLEQPATLIEIEQVAI